MKIMLIFKIGIKIDIKKRYAKYKEYGVYGFKKKKFINCFALRKNSMGTLLRPHLGY